MEDIGNSILGYLKKQAQANTYRLARELGIPRHEILQSIKELEEQQLIKFRCGTAKFLQLPKKASVIDVSSKESFQEENERLREQLSELQVAIKQQPSMKNKLKEQDKYIQRLQETVKQLQQKASASPKDIEKVVIKRVPIKAINKEANPWQLKEPRFIRAWVKNMQQLYIPEVLRVK